MGVSKVRVRGKLLWRARVCIDGKTRTAYRRRRDEALKAERELRGEMAAGPVTPDEVPTLADFSEFFLETYAATNNRPSTVREKRRALGRGLLDELGALRLDAIGLREIERFKARRKREGRAPKTINEELAILGKMLQHAHEIGDLPAAPPKIRRFKMPTPKFDFLDFDEAERLHTAAANSPDPWRAMIPAAMLTGLRLGELRGLQWDDLDLEDARLQVRRAADDMGDLHPPKSYRTRVVYLPRRAVAVLQTARHELGPFVFCEPGDGSLLSDSRCRSHLPPERDNSPLAAACRRAGLRRVGWHTLRHTYASHLVMRGATLMEVRELLGHTSITTTMRYAHLSPNARRGAVALLDSGTCACGDGSGDGEEK